MVETRKCVDGLPLGMDHYHKEIFKKFPCPTGYRELVFGEDVENVYDRITLRPIKIAFWDEWGGQLYHTETNGSHGEYYVWYVVKVK